MKKILRHLWLYVPIMGIFQAKSSDFKYPKLYGFYQFVCCIIALSFLNTL